MDALTAIFIAWIVAKTGFIAPEPPRIALVPSQQMSHFFDEVALGNQEPQKHPADAQNTPDADGLARIQAFYARDTATVYLPMTWRVAALRDRGILLHELVHHVQRFNKVVPSCPGALERQAYDLQVTWLREQGVADPYELIGTDQFTIQILTVCMPPDW